MKFLIYELPEDKFFAGEKKEMKMKKRRLVKNKEILKMGYISAIWVVMAVLSIPSELRYKIQEPK